AESKPDRFPGNLPAVEVIVDDWSVWDQRFGISLVQRTPALSHDSVIRFADGIRVVKSEIGDPRVVDEGGYYILRNDDLEFTLEPNLEPWVRFLRCVNGSRSVNEILSAAGVADREVWKHLEEAVEYDVLNVVPTVHDREILGGYAGARASSPHSPAPDSFMSRD